jgi:hypothetical protein
MLKLVGRQGKKKRKPVRHLPKVSGNPGQLWGDEPTPWVIGGESSRRWIGRAGPAAQDAYFRRHKAAAAGFRVIGILLAATVVIASVAAVVFR